MLILLRRETWGHIDAYRALWSRPARRWPLSDAGLSFQQSGGPVVDGWRRVRWMMLEDHADLRTQKTTFGEIRSTGVRDVLIYCRDHRCSHHVEINADGCSDDVQLSDIEPKFVCQICGAARTSGRSLGQLAWARVSVGKCSMWKRCDCRSPDANRLARYMALGMNRGCSVPLDRRGASRTHHLVAHPFGVANCQTVAPPARGDTQQGKAAAP